MTDDKETVKLKREHGYTYSTRLPKPWVKQLQIFLLSEVVLEKIGDNPLNWEIRIRPLSATEKKLKGRGS